MFLQEQYNDAVGQLQQLLQQQPNDYTALAQLLMLLRRVGRVQEGQGFLQTAQEHASRAVGTAGEGLVSRKPEHAPQHVTKHKKQHMTLSSDVHDMFCM